MPRERSFANSVAKTLHNELLSDEDARRLDAALCDLAQRAEARPDKVLELQGMDLQLSAAPVLGGPAEEASVVVALHDISVLKTLERMKSQFVSDVSHELRTPITSIKLYTQLLRQSPPEKREAYLDALECEVARQAQIVEDVLQFSRLDAGRLDLNLVRCSLNTFVASLLSGHLMLAQNKGVALVFIPVVVEPIVLADLDKLTRVLHNLLDNALRYTFEGGVVSISTGMVEAQDQRWATVTVADTGIGIAPGDLPYIFERFYRGSAAREQQIEGTGLGLAIAREIVQLHGGQITVESQLGVGSRFMVWLPDVV